MATHDDCCAPYEGTGAAGGHATDLAHFGGDVTGMSCCERDRVETARVDSIKAGLLAVDPTTKYERIKHNVLHVPPLQEDDESSDFGDDEEVDDLALAAFRDARLAEMARQARAEEERRKMGLGCLTAADPSALLELARTSDSTVCHFPLQGAPVRRIHEGAARARVLLRPPALVSPHLLLCLLGGWEGWHDP
mmetsp:Transcript_47557/g.152396  ORF Transcript_47557/g.152396 Transcript_47557/m.152396 type:complete len:193 (+) Transcript_47557:171-749(+)